MRKSRLARSVMTLAAGGLLAATTAVPSAGAVDTSGYPADVVKVPVSFTVQNVNRSQVPCAADGKSYTVRGDIVAPKSLMTEAPGKRAITLYLHGLSFGEFFWNFGGSGSDYDYANKLAQAGQASLIVDRLGYGNSDKPAGNAICAGARADVAHQIVQQLRTGSLPFAKVYLAGHSFGGQIAQVEAYSFHDVDGIVVISYTDVGQTKTLADAAAYTAKVCAAGGKPVTPNGPGGYSSFGPPSGAPKALFNETDPKIEAAALPKLTIDPCGDSASFAAATAFDKQRLGSIDVPVQLLQGGADALFAAGAQRQQASLYTGSPSVRAAIVPGSGHAITLERNHKLFTARMVGALQHFERLSS